MREHLFLPKMFVAALLLSFGLGATSAAAPNQSFKRKAVSNARFGEGDREKYLKAAHQLAAEIGKDVKGQETAAQILQNRVVQYFENFGNRNDEPVYMNLIGLPGVGKTAMLSKLISLGFPVVHYDAQSFAKSVRDDFTPSIWVKIQEANNEGKPLIIVVEELDKVPEIKGQGEETSFVVGTINQILSDGVVSYSGTPMNAHNVMVLTTMNFAPNEMERFTEDVLSEKKSFYDLTIEDMQKFNDWIKSQPSARYKILSHLFRSNTVRRMAPFTVIMQPLLEDTYREIIRGVVREAIARNTTGKNAGKRVEVDVDQSVIDFLYRETVYAPSGAGETVLRADAIVDQLINFSIKAQNGPHDDSVDRPRKASIAIDPLSSKARITVTPYVYRHPNLQPLPSFEVDSEFDRSSGLFMPPAELAVTKPVYKNSGKQENEKPVTQKQTMAFRYPPTKNSADGLRESIESQLLGQDAAIDLVENEMNKYLALSKPPAKEPMFKVLSGFPGIGKSEIVKITATHLKLPVVKVNMQQFVSDNPKTIDDFLATVNSEIAQKQKEIAAAGGKFIFLLEELDKAYEVDPKTGLLINRPIMAIIKDLLNEGRVSVSSQGLYGGPTKATIDISAAYTFVTMNFSVDRFGFTADPRMTTVDDVIAAWAKLNTSVASIKQLLGSMFLPETVSRIMSQFVIMKPLTADDYRQVISKQTAKVVNGRIFDGKGRNVGKIRVALSPRYKQYLFNETVIPSEGARSTVVRSQGLISTDLEKAISALPKSKFGAKPILLTLDFYPGTTEVIVRAQLDEGAATKGSGEVILKKPVALTFPRIDMKGKMPETRLKTSAHELGHALVATRLGLRIDQVVVVPTLPGAGGYVKFKGSQSHAIEIMANVYATLASRAMERIVLSKDPRSPLSVLEITAGPSQDIKQASQGLFNMIYELGFDPNGGTIDRNFMIGPTKYADYASIPHELAEKLGTILRRMENQVLEDLLASHSKDWYVEKTSQLARKGAMDEKEFYDLIQYEHPGDNVETYGRTSNIRDLFQKVIRENPAALKKAQAQKRGLNNETVEETVERYLTEFAEILQAELHPEIQNSRPRGKMTCDGAILHP